MENICKFVLIFFNKLSKTLLLNGTSKHTLFMDIFFAQATLSRLPDKTSLIDAFILPLFTHEFLILKIKKIRLSRCFFLRQIRFCWWKIEYFLLNKEYIVLELLSSVLFENIKIFVLSSQSLGNARIYLNLSTISQRNSFCTYVNTIHLHYTYWLNYHIKFL